MQIHKDDLAVDEFAAAMKARLAEKRRLYGKSGWQTDDPSLLAERLKTNLTEKANPLDVANYAMMLFIRGFNLNGQTNRV